MAEPKPFASLSSGLLARKGAAKPAMRPQAFGSFGGNIEDLGWNDMGQAGPEHVPTSLEALTPARAAPRHVSEPEAETDVPEPVVVEQQRALEESFAQAAVEPEPEAEAEAEAEAAYEEPAEEPEIVHAVEPAAVVPIRQRRAAPAKGKAAFTLRLDPDRHLKLRLACAVTRRSAQQLVTGALDDFLSGLPEIQALADRVPAEAGRRGR
jgi:hypothetical protein